MVIVFVIICCVAFAVMIFSIKDKMSHSDPRAFLEKEEKKTQYKYKKNGTILELWEKGKSDLEFVHTGSIDISTNLILPLNKKAKTTTLARLLKISRLISNGDLPECS